MCWPTWEFSLCHGGCLKSKRLHKLALLADSALKALECNINISVKSMFKHVEMQKGTHFTHWFKQ